MNLAFEVQKKTIERGPLKLLRICWYFEYRIDLSNRFIARILKELGVDLEVTAKAKRTDFVSRFIFRRKKISAEVHCS